MEKLRFCLRYTDLSVYAVISQFKIKKHFVCGAGAVTLFDVAKSDVVKLQNSEIFNGTLGNTIAFFKENNGKLFGVNSDRFVYFVTKDSMGKTEQRFPIITFGGSIFLLNYRFLVNMVKDIDLCEHDFKNEKKNGRAKESNIYEYQETKSCFKKYKYLDTDTECIIPLRLYIPKNNDKNQEKPLVIIGTGADTLGYDNKKTLRIAWLHSLTQKLQKKDCIIAIPQFSRLSNQRDPQFYKALNNFVKWICTQEYINQKQVYYIGISHGAFLGWDIVYKQPENITAAILLVGGFQPVGVAEKIDYNKFKDVYLYVAHSENDKNVKIDCDDNTVENIQKVSDKIQYDRYTKYGHSLPFFWLRRVHWEEYLFQKEK